MEICLRHNYIVHVQVSHLNNTRQHSPRCLKNGVCLIAYNCQFKINLADKWSIQHTEESLSMRLLANFNAVQIVEAVFIMVSLLDKRETLASTCSKNSLTLLSNSDFELASCIFILAGIGWPPLSVRLTVVAFQGTPQYPCKHH